MVEGTSQAVLESSDQGKPTYKQKLGLRVTNRDVKTSAVIEAVCLFCKYFGRQIDMANRKRAVGVTNQTYGLDFRADVMTKHMESQHHEKWSEYQALSLSEQFKFFNGIVSRNNMLHRYIEIDDDELTLKISNVVVDTIIGELLFRPEDEMIMTVIGHTRDVMSIGKLSVVSDHLVGKYVRVFVGVALTKIGVLLSSDDVWAFSIAFDGSTHHSTAFFDVRIRIFVKGILYNFQLIVNYVNHQADLIVQAIVELIDGGDFVAKVYEATVYLHKQNTLITEMGVANPKKMNRWVALNSIIAFLDKRHEQRGVAVPPVLSETWWVQVFAVAPSLELVHKMFCELQARLLFICQQRAYVNKLAIDLDGFGDLDASNYFQQSNWFVTFKSLELFVCNQGSRIEGHFDAIDDSAQCDVLTLIGMFAAERNSRNEPADKEAPPVMPSDLVRVQPVMFFHDVLQPRNVHLIKANWDEDAIYEIEQQHRNLVKAYKYEPPFNDAWEALGIRFTTLRTFCDGLTTLFPNSTSVESDFSVLKWEKDPYRDNLLDLSLKGVFQSKQFEALAII
ncbi:hypothetical protein CY35_17G095900 [Sphagnum magellanicum]|nr:hypothetical protein CY35_17G095900 [Sphagnum magellanicum]